MRCWFGGRGGAAVALLALACEPTPPAGTGGVQVEESFGPSGQSCGRGLAVVMTDYASTNVGLLGLDGATLSGSLISSASADPTLNASLTGDVVFPSSRMSGDLLLLDRFPVSVITSVDLASAEVNRQVAVRTGFDSNPQDLVVLDDGTLLVSRLEKNRSPGEEEFDQGDDLLRLAAGEIVGRIDLSRFADEQTGRARPGRMLRDDQHVYVSLTRHDGSFDDAGEAGVLRLDAADGTTRGTLEIPGMKNCAGLALSPDGSRLALSCSGLVDRANSSAPEHSGVVVLRLDLTDDAEAEEVFRIRAEELNFGPFAPALGFADNDFLWIGTYGALDGDDAGRPDRVLSLDLATGSHDVILESVEDAFTLGDIRCISACGVCFVADAGRSVVHRFSLNGGVVASFSRHSVESEIGLPPRGLGWF